MKLSQDTKVVNALNDILEGIDYLEYSESKSKNQDFLHVDLTDPERDRNFSDIEDVIFKLRKSTGRKFEGIDQIMIFPTFNQNETPTDAGSQSRKMPRIIS